MNELEEILSGLPCRKIHAQLFIGFILISLEHFSNGLTNPDDVAAINSLYVAFGSPMIPGWVPNGGDPCGEAWQGVQCDTSNNIVSIILVDASLGGGLGDNLGSFSSLKLIDFSNNHIGGNIPTSFPVSITHFFLSDNNFTGSIPDSLSSLTQLSGLKINENHLSGDLPDSFQSLTNLAILDLANNSLSGKLPPSMDGLSALTSLHLQSNQLSGTLDALQDLPLQDLDISDNQFNGPIPEKLLSIPTFKKDGNPFNISPLPSPTAPSTGFFPSSPPTPSSGPPHSGTTPSGSTPPGTTPTGSTPPGATPSGPTPPGTTPSGSKPPGTTPSGSTPSGSTPSGTTPSGSTPSGTTPSGSTPSETTPSGTTPSGSTPSGTTPSGSTSPGTTPSGSISGPHGKQASSPSAQDDSGSGSDKKRTRTTKIAGIVVGSVIGFIVLTLFLMLCVPAGIRRSEKLYRTSRRHEIEPYEAPPNRSSVQPNTQIEKVQAAAVAAPKQEPHTETRRTAAIPKPHTETRRTAAIPKQPSDLGLYSQRKGLLQKQDSELSMSDIDLMVPPPPPPPPPPCPPPPPPLPLAQKVTMNPITSREAPMARPLPKVLQTPVRSFTIAYLQEYTNSFSQDNLIGSGMLGSVYRAEAPGGKLLAVKKLDRGVCSRQKEHDFIELVNNIDKIRHANVVELVGYCSEHGHRLLVYEYCGNGTLQDALHSDDEYRKKLSWNARIQMAIGAARALEYLHEVCEPPIIHRNFKSGNILLDEDLSVRVSDCGLAPLIGSGSVSQLSGHLLSTYGYGAPEFETGIYTQKSDVYSFGVIMLEILTGRISYDRTRTRGEQILVRWAVPQLHDIDALQGMVDPYLIGEYPAKFLSHFADIIFRCVQAEPKFRPQMSQVVQDLQHLLQRG